MMGGYGDDDNNNLSFVITLILYIHKQFYDQMPTLGSCFRPKFCHKTRQLPKYCIIIIFVPSKLFARVY